MEFNRVKVTRTEPGAELEGIVYDQWLHIEHKGTHIAVFDSEMYAPENYKGYLAVKISVMHTELSPAKTRRASIDPPFYTGQITDVESHGTHYEYTVDVDDLDILLEDTEKYRKGSYITFKGRLDLDEVHGTPSRFWTNA